MIPELQLAALQIPSGWILHQNTLFNEEPLLPDGTENHRFMPSEDLIWFERIDFSALLEYAVSVAVANPRLHEQEDLAKAKEAWEVAIENKQPTTRTLHIDVGWYGGDATEGSYFLRVFKDWNAISHEFETRSTVEVIAQLNYCLSNFLQWL